MAVSNACNEVFSAEAEWKRERRAAKKLAEAQKEFEKYKDSTIHGPLTRQALQRAQQEYDDANKPLADRRAVIVRMLDEATRIAQGSAGEGKATIKE